MTVKSVHNAYPRVFGVADYEFIIRFIKFNMVAEIFENNGKISTKCPPTGF